MLAWLAGRPHDLPAIGHRLRGKPSGFHRGHQGWGKEENAGNLFRGPMRWDRDGNDAQSFFRGPFQRGRDGGDAGAFRWSPQGFAPSSTTSGIFY